MLPLAAAARGGGCTGQSGYKGRVTAQMFGCAHLPSLYEEGAVPGERGTIGSSWKESQHLLPEAMGDVQHDSVQVFIYLVY